MRCVLLHYHIFKNAGSTVEEALARCFDQTFARTETSQSEGLVLNRDLLAFLERNPNVKALSSHQIRHPAPTAPGFLFLDLCILRDPIDRVRSIYDFYHSRPAPGDPLSDLARGSIGEFVAGAVREQQLHIKNVQVNLLACTGDSDEPEEKDFRVALERIRSTAILGVVDCFNKSMVAGQYAAQPIFPELDFAQPAENVTGGLEGDLARRLATLRAACDESDFDELLRLNALDMRLLECAREEVERRFRRTPDACGKLEDFEHRIQAPLGARSSSYMRRCERQPQAAPRLKPPVAPVSSAGVLTRLGRLARVPLDAFSIWLCRRRYGISLFDARYYRATYQPDTTPLLHFLLRGAFEGKKPHPLFDPEFYLRMYPDVAASGVNPLGHYLRRGAAQQRQPSAYFDPVYYLARNPDVRSIGAPPFLHFVRNGAHEMRKPHPLFQPEHYARVCAGARIDAGGLLAHFAACGSNAASPHPLFDCGSYLAAHPELAERDENPLADYLSGLRDRHARGSSKVPPGIGYLEAAQFVIDDVPVAVVFSGDGAPRKYDGSNLPTLDMRERNGGLPPSLVVVSMDAAGAVSIEAEPQQRPFFEAIPFEQLYAQANARL